MKNNPRLLLVLPWMVMGGAERFALNLIDQLNERHWQTTVVCTAPSNNTWYGEFAKRTRDIFVLPDIIPIRDYPRFFRYLIDWRDFDAMLLQGSMEGYRLLPTLRALFPRLPILDYLHFVTPGWMNGGFPRLSVLYRDGIDMTITSCNQVAQWVVQAGVDEKGLRTSPIGVDPERFRPDVAAREQLRHKLEIQPDETVIIYSARLEAQKQPLVFAEVIKKLVVEGAAFHALVAGEGTLRPALEEKIHEYGLEGIVHLLGAVPGEDMPALMAAGDIFFLPSQNEGLSSAIYEAMACGMPVVGADVGGQAELVTPECGILIPELPEDQRPVAYAQVLNDLISDETKRMWMGTLSRKRILNEFTLSHMGDSITTILEEVIRKKQVRLMPYRILSDEEKKLRETQHVIEYLQARQEWHIKNQQTEDLMRRHEELYLQYSELFQPKAASHWFYLWIRQLFLPLFGTLKVSCFGQTAISVQQGLKRRWIKE